MIVDLDQYTDEELVVHYGVKGMQWGRRRGKSTTGVTRHRGALIDRNNRLTSRMKATAKGDKSKSTVGGRAAVGVARAILGRDRYKRNMEKRISTLNAQNSRLKSGKLKVMDRLDLTLNVSALDLVVSNRPK